MPLNSIFLHESNRPIRPHAYDPFAQICNFLITKKVKGESISYSEIRNKKSEEHRIQLLLSILHFHISKCHELEI